MRTSPSSDTSIPSLIRDSVRRRPEACALLYLDAVHSRSSPPRQHRWTYRETWSAARTMARALRAAHGRDTDRCRVGVMIDEGPLWPVLELAIILAKMVIIPLDAGDPRLRFVIEDSAPTLIVTKDESTSRVALEALCPPSVPSSCPPPLVLTAADLLPLNSSFFLRVCLDKEDRHRRNETKNNEEKNEEADDDDDLAPPPRGAVSHIFFTSGSTGRPKGCVVSHSALLSYCKAKSHAHLVDEDSVCFVASSLTFDPSLGDFFSTWCSGGVVALAPRSLIFSSLGACLAATKATHLLATPSLFGTITLESVSSHPDASSSSPSPPPSSSSTTTSRTQSAVASLPDRLPDLRVVALGGEPMSRETMEAWSANDRLSVINTYGVTECCVYQTAAFLRPGSPTPKLLGEPLPGNQILVMRKAKPQDGLHSCSGGAGGDDPADMLSVEEGSGEEGELWIAGDQVGEGYLNLPELTARKFVDHPRYGRCFRTGDLVAAFPSGARGWKLIGRSDGQVKIRGQRVELGEIEEALLSVSSPSLIRSAAVVVSAHGATEGQLVAFCVPSPPATAATSSPCRELLSDLLRLLCEERLPRHMVPSRFAFISSLPTTRTGKIARAVLAKQNLPPVCMSSRAADDGEASSDKSDDFWTGLVSEVWAQVLGLEGLMLTRTNVHFVELGGDSLAGLRVCQGIARKIDELKIKRRRVEGGEDNENNDNDDDEADRKPKPKGNVKEEEGPRAGNAAGEFGELLGPLAPAELLKRPRLLDFARHLREAFEDDNASREDASNRSGAPIRAAAAGEAILISEDHRRRDTVLLQMLYRAASAGAGSIVRFLLDHRSGLHPDGRHVATDEGDRTAPRPQLANRKRGTSAGSSGGPKPPRRYFTPLHAACANGHADIVFELLARGASPTIADPSGVQPIHLAAQKGPVEVLDALLTFSSSTKQPKAVNPIVLTAKDDNLQCVLHHAARADAPGKVMDYLLEKWTVAAAGTTKKGTRGGAVRGSGGSGGGVDCLDRWRRTPLHWAVVNGHRTMVVKLLALGADRKRMDDRGETPLAIAERRARCGAKERPDGMGASVFGDIAKLLGGSGSTKRVSTYM